MRPLRLALGTAFAALLHAPSAAAGPLTSVSLTFALGTIPPSTYSASGLVGAGSAQGNLGTATWSVAAGAVPSGSLSTSVTGLPFVTKVQVVISGNPGAGFFSAGTPNPMAVTGIAKAKGFGGVTLLKIPVAAGAPGTFVAGAGLLKVTARFESWTTQTASVMTAMGGAGPTAMGANGLLFGAGTVVLVSGLNVMTAAAGQIPGFAFLTLNYAAPEPGTLLLVAIGGTGLFLLGRRKQRT